MLPEATLQALTVELISRHGCHAVLLYGSQARGEATETSDIDLLGLRVGSPTRDVRTWEGLQLDAVIEPESSADRVLTESDLRLRGALVLHDECGLASRLLERVEAFFLKGPPRLDEGSRQGVLASLDGLLGRLDGTALGDLRRVSLLSEALPLLSQLRGRWYPGPRQALRELEAELPEVFASYREALRPGAPDAALTAFVRAVQHWGQRSGS